MNLKEIKELIKLISENGFTEFEIEREGFRLRVSRGASPTSAVPIVVSQPFAPASPAALPPQSSQPEAAVVSQSEQAKQEAADASLHIIKSPLVGTFYRSPSPNSDPFVRIGDRVEPDTIVCIIEAMKLMNNIQAEVTGEVAKIFVEDGQPVEYGQPLFGVRTGADIGVLKPVS